MEEKGIRIYNEDCIKGMKETEPKEIFDMVFTDPPFNISQDENASNKLKNMKYRGGDLIHEEWDKYTEEEFYHFTLNWMSKASKLLRPKGWFCTFCSFKYIPMIVGIGERLGLKYQNLITWFKPDAALGFPVGYTCSCEYVVVFYKSSMNSNFTKYINTKNIQRDCIIRKTLHGKERESTDGHPSPKPVDLLEKLIKHVTKEGDWILDPFIGSGSTSVACIRNKRNCIGFEINKKYYETTLKRIKSEMEKRELGEWF